MDQSDLINLQDNLRTRRAFVSFLSTAMGVDQALPDTDGYAANTSYRYQSIGPNGVGVEGAPLSTAQGRGVAGVPNVVLLAGVVLCAVLLARNVKG